MSTKAVYALGKEGGNNGYWELISSLCHNHIREMEAQRVNTCLMLNIFSSKPGACTFEEAQMWEKHQDVGK